MENYSPEVCEHCGQTKTYLLGIDQGTVDTLKAISTAIRNKGINVIHPRKEMEAKGITYFEMVKFGKLTSNQVGNLTRLRSHGLIARVKGNPGNYCLTKKGSAFLRGETIPRFAIVSKSEKHQIGYWTPADMGRDATCNILDFKHMTEYWEGINYEVEEGRVIYAPEAK